MFKRSIKNPFDEDGVGNKQSLQTVTSTRPQKPEDRVPGRISKLERSVYEREEYESMQQFRKPKKIRTRPREEEEPTITSLLEPITKQCPSNCGWKVGKNNRSDQVTC